MTEFENKDLKPIKERKKSVFKYMNNELCEFKEFVKNKVEPVKMKVVKVQKEIESFKNPILQELITIRNQNEALLRELTRQKKIYREMLGEFYKMIAANEAHAESMSLKDPLNSSFITKDSPISAHKRSNMQRHWRIGQEDLTQNILPPSGSPSKINDISLANPPLEELEKEMSRPKSTPKNLILKTKRTLNESQMKSGRDFTLTDNLKKMQTPLNINLRKNLSRL